MNNEESDLVRAWKSVYFAGEPVTAAMIGEEAVARYPQAHPVISTLFKGDYRHDRSVREIGYALYRALQKKENKAIVTYHRVKGQGKKEYVLEE